MKHRTIEIGRLDLVGGASLDSVKQQVTSYGELNSRGTNAVLVPHALTGSSRAGDWWPGLIGEGKLIDPNRWHVIGINALGSCYGSSRTLSRITVEDMVAAQVRALDQLGIERLALVIGGSLGGMQALQWALGFPERVARAAMIGSHDHYSPMGVAFNAIQREAIGIQSGAGLRLARKIAMLTYKSQQLLQKRHGRRSDRLGRFEFDVEGYLEHQADAFEGRMDAQSYVTLTHAMDSFDVRDFAVHDTSPELLFVGISSDWLFLAHDVRKAAARFSTHGFSCIYRELQTDHGHDAFLAEAERLAPLLQDALPPDLYDSIDT